MKIAFLSVFYPYRGGISQFSAELYEALSREASVEAFNFKRQYPDFLFPGKTQYVSDDDRAIRVSAPRVLDSINPLSWLKTAKAIRRSRPDVVAISYWMSFFAPATGFVARYLRRRGIKVIALVHNAIPHEPKPYDKPFAKWFFKKCDGFVALSEAVKDDILKLCPKARIMLREHPLYDHFGAALPKDAARKALGLPQDRKVLLFFGLIRDYKGLDLLIDAVKSLDEGHQLLIAGECYGSFDRYEAMIAGADNIKVINRYIPDEEVPILFSAADVCVLPYRSATQSGVTAVALNFNLPLIATRVGGLAQSIEEPGIGIIAEDISSEAIAGAIRQFFDSDPQRYIDNIAELKKDMTWNAFAEALLEFL